MNKYKVKQCKLLESQEISPIKIVSHNSNKIMELSNCTLLEVFDENSDKENSKCETLSNKIVKQKVFISSRYKTSNINKKHSSPVQKYDKNTPEINSFGSLKASQLQLTGKSEENVNRVNKCKNVIQIKSTLIPKSTESKNVQHRTNKAASKSTQNKLANPDPSIKELESGSLDASVTKTSQKTLDIAYCQYLQSLYLNTHFKQTIDTQEQEFLESYRKLNFENEDLTMSLTLLNLFHDIDSGLLKQEYATEMLKDSLDFGVLENLKQQVEICSDLIDVTSNLDVQNLDNCDLSLIGNHIKNQLKVNGEDVVKMFTEIDSNLTEINTLLKFEFKEVEKLKDISVKLFSDLLNNKCTTNELNQ